jgi:hypothetical protein
LLEKEVERLRIENEIFRKSGCSAISSLSEKLEQQDEILKLIIIGIFEKGRRGLGVQKSEPTLWNRGICCERAFAAAAVAKAETRQEGSDKN